MHFVVSLHYISPSTNPLHIVPIGQGNNPTANRSPPTPRGTQQGWEKAHVLRVRVLLLLLLLLLLLFVHAGGCCVATSRLSMDV